MMHRYTYGPVPSRRLGRSLGVDLVPFKTCTYDCIYCQLGRTSTPALEREAWVPLDEVVAEVEARLSTRPDYITLAGSGEPTLHAEIGELITRLKAVTEIPVVVLTNGSLLWREDVRRGLMAADLVIPSLDAGDEAMFRRVNRPHGGISFGTMVEGLVRFRREFAGQVWLEVMVVGGYTDTAEEIAKIAGCAARMRPDRVQLNTVTRPAAEADAIRVPHERLEELARLFDPPAEVIADDRGAREPSDAGGGRREILVMLRRRPCSLEDIARGLGMHENEVIKHLEELERRGEVKPVMSGERRYYQVVR